MWSLQGLRKKKLLHLNMNLVQLHYFYSICGNSQCDTLAYLGQNCNLRLKPWQGALLEESFQCNHRKLKQNSWHDAELSAKAQPAWREGCCCCSGVCALSLTPVWCVQVSLHNHFLPARGVRQLEWALGRECNRDSKIWSVSNPLCYLPQICGGIELLLRLLWCFSSGLEFPRMWPKMMATAQALLQDQPFLSFWSRPSFCWSSSTSSGERGARKLLAARHITISSFQASPLTTALTLKIFLNRTVKKQVSRG